MIEINNFIGGKNVASETDNYISLNRPTTGEEYAKVPITTKKEFDKVIEVMKIAQLEWAETALTKRASILFKFKNLIEKILMR